MNIFLGGGGWFQLARMGFTDNPAVHPHQPYIVAVYRAAVCRRIKPFSRHKLCSHYYILPSIFMAWLLTACPPVLMGKKPSGYPSLATRDGTYQIRQHCCCPCKTIVPFIRPIECGHCANICIWMHRSTTLVISTRLTSLNLPQESPSPVCWRTVVYCS